MKKIRQYWPTALVLLIIMYATWVPHPLPDADIPAIPYLDKLIHAIMMGGFEAAMMFDWYRVSPRIRRLSARMIILFTAIAMGFAVADEVVQGMLPIGRTSDPLDIFAGWAGCVIAVLAAPAAIRRVLRRQRR